jgi:hypothetical protein
MHRYRGLFRLKGEFTQHQFSADYTISMLGFDFRQGQATLGRVIFREYAPSSYFPSKYLRLGNGSFSQSIPRGAVNSFCKADSALSKFFTQICF